MSQQGKGLNFFFYYVVLFPLTANYFLSLCPCLHPKLLASWEVWEHSLPLMSHSCHACSLLSNCYLNSSTSMCVFVRVGGVKEPKTHSVHNITLISLWYPLLLSASKTPFWFNVCLQWWVWLHSDGLAVWMHVRQGEMWSEGGWMEVSVWENPKHAFVLKKKTQNWQQGSLVMIFQ